MKLKAKDQLHVSSVQAASLRAGEEFEVSDPIGKDLVKRGLATAVRASKPKAAKKPNNKKAPAPENKSAS